MRENKYTFNKAILSIITIGFIGLIFVLWVIFLYPLIATTYPVWSLFLIFYVLIISFWLTFFIGFFGLGLKAFKGGIILSIFSAVFDLYYPPFAINLDGTLATSDSIGYRGSIDYTVGFYLTRAGLSGIAIFIFTYFLLPILVFLFLLILLKPDKFRKSIRSS